MIEIKNLSKSFQTKASTVKALEDINLTVNDGEIFGIIGLSGAGKSTLVRCINLLEKPDEGAVIVNGTDLTKVSEKELRLARRNIGMIFQNFNLLEQRTAIANVCFPLEIIGVKKQEAEKRATELLEIVGLKDKAQAYPSQLSGGQKQRVAIARALATNPKYLLCDEATSALDPNTTASILELLQSINQQFGVTIIIITHEMSVIEKACDKVAVIDRSRIVEVGDVEEIFTNPQSEIARQLILPSQSKIRIDGEQKGLRLIFNGESYTEPVLSGLVRDCGLDANVLFADIKEINGKNYGHMFLSFPSESDIQTATAWLDSKNVNYTREA
jgi:D-methionine transport system ATP-binding protein